MAGTGRIEVWAGRRWRGKLFRRAQRRSFYLEDRMSNPTEQDMARDLAADILSQAIEANT